MPLSSLQIANIPAELKSLPQWVGWKLVQRDGKATKLPVNPKTGDLASSTDPSTWGTIQEALIATEKYGLPGIGFAFSEHDSFCGVDLDSCRNPETGEVELWAQQHIDRFNSYTETSPSGKGVHIILKGTLPPGGRRKGKIEHYDRARYFTFTGNVLNGCLAIAERQAELEAFHKELFRAQEIEEAHGSRSSMPAEPLDLDDEELLSLALNADDGGKFSKLWAGDWDKAEYASHSEVDLALCCKLAFWTGRDKARMDRLFRQSKLYRKKWDRADYSGATLDRAIDLCDEVYKRPRFKAERSNGECPPVEWSDEYMQAPSSARAPERSKPQAQYKGILTGAEFPLDVMSGFAGDFARIYSQYLEPPIQFFYMASLTCLGNILSGQITLESEIAPQPRVNLLILAESADDRKSTVLEKTTGFFRSFSFDRLLNLCFGVGSAEGLQAKLSDIAEGGGPKRLLLVYDEFKSFVGKCKIEGSVLLPCVTTLFESNRYESRTKHSKIELEDVHLSILAASTVDTFNNMWTSQFTDIGFNNRLFLVTGKGERRFSIPRKVPESAFDRLKQKLAGILSAVHGGREFKVTDEAFLVFDSWYRGLESSVHTKRLDTYALRFMPLLAANDSKEMVDLETVQKAIALCNWQLHIRKMHDPIDCDSAMARMEEKMRRILKAKGYLKDWELKRETHANRDGLWIYERAKQNMLKAREITFDRTTKEYGWIEE